jgi:peptidoglycan/LPS O-acetylase OafA/YrhL
MNDALAIEPGYHTQDSRLMERRPQPPEFRPDIEGMRAVAIIMVVAYHSGTGLFSGGFVGVDVFFILSGYLITDLLVREIERTGRVSFRRFYARRAKRLLPASLALVVCTLLLSFVILSPLEVLHVAQTALATASYSSNLLFIFKSTDYFGAGVGGNPLLHTWSLAVEEQFYLVWPLLLVLCMKRNRPRLVAAGVLALLAALSLVICIWLTYRFQPIAFFSTPTRTWEFAVGGLAALLQENERLKLLRLGAFAWLGAACVLASGIFLRSAQGFPGALALLPVAGTTLILIAGKYSISQGGVLRVLKHPIAQKIGALSYSWYLWHWPVLVFGRILFPHGGWVTTVTLLLTGLAAAWLSYSLIESPVRFNSKLTTKPGYALALGVGLTMAGILVSLSALRWASHLENTKPEVAFLRASSGSPDDDRCATGFRSDRLTVCSFGATGRRTVVLFGDSHAGQWIPAMRDPHIVGWHVVTLLKSACPSVSIPIYNPHLERVDENCTAWREKALEYIRSIKPAVVILCNSSGYVKRPFFEDQYAQVTLEQWEQGMRSTLESLDTGTTSVLLVRDTPRASFDIPICLSRAQSHPHLFSAQDCMLEEPKAIAEPVWRAERAAATGLSYVVALDLTAQFCPGGECKPIIHNMVVYRDGNHITGAFSASLAPVMAAQLQSIDSSEEAAAR